jgi:hypothetical protein
MDGSQQGGKLQQWLNLAETQSHVALLPPGNVTCDRELVVPDGVRVVGAGIYASQIQWLPLAAGQSAMRSAGSVFEIGHLHLRGPGGDVTAGGQTIAAMDGLKLNTRSYVESVRADHFHAGSVVTADHIFINGLEASQNEYGLLWNNADTSGDNQVFGVLAVGCSKASVGITNRAIIENAVFQGSHFGGAPYGMHRFSVGGTTRPNFLLGVHFLNSGWEGCANGAIFDEVGDGGIINVVFDPIGENATFEGPIEWSGKPSRAWIDVGGGASGLRWRNTWALPKVGRPLIRAADVVNVQVDEADHALQELEADPDLRMIETDGVISSVRVGTGGLRMTTRRASETLLKGDLCEATADDGARRWRGGRPVGIAVHPVLSGEVLTLLVAGRSDNTQPRNLTGETIPNGSLLRPDPDHPGGVKRAADWQDGPLVGQVFGDYPVDASGEYELWE